MGAGNTPDYIRKLKSARGHVYQLDTQLSFCLELKYVQEDDCAVVKGELDECERVLAGLIKSLGG